MRRTTALPLLVLVLLGVVAHAVRTTDASGASFVAVTGNVATVRAAADWTAPSVALDNPGSPVRGTVTLAATATDAESAVTSVAFQYLAPGASAWVTVCTDATAPYSCSWATTGLADGSYELRARASNAAGYTATSEQVAAIVANSVLLVLGSPGELVHGNVPLTATLHNGGALPWVVTIQYVVAGGSSWKTLCTGLTSPLGCTWQTASFANEAYDLRATATSGLTTVTSAVVADVLVDNAAPAVTMTDPGSPLSGWVTFGATASDAGSGVNQVAIQAARSGGDYQTLCTVASEPYGCRYATTSLADGSYAFRAVATDAAGNTATSAAVTGRTVDNTVSSVSVDDPGAYLSGVVTVTAQANSTAGVVSVRLQRTAAGQGWTDLCTVTAAPYSCPWDTRTVANGSYDLRAVLVDGRGATTTSAVVTGRRVDNSSLRAVDVQTANGEGVPGRVDQGDTMTLTYSETLALGSVTTGWTGSAIPVTLRLRDGNLVGGGNKGDVVDVLRNGAAVQLGSVALREDYVKARRTVTFNATLRATTVTVDGVQRSVVTVTVGTVASGNGLRTVSTATSLLWTPATAATAATGGACAATPATESGPADREF